MGISAQEHRVVTGLFAGRMSSANWTHSTGSYKAYKRKRKLDADPRFCWSLIMLLLVIIVTTVQLWLVSPHLTTICDLWQWCLGESSKWENSWSNQSASTTVREYWEETWAMHWIWYFWPPHWWSSSTCRPGNEIVAELNSRKFTVSMLQPALAWLLNKPISDTLIQTVKKTSWGWAVPISVKLKVIVEVAVKVSSWSC